MRRILRAVATALLATSASLAGAATCSVSAVSLAFGNYNQFQSSHSDTVGTIAVTCSGNAGESVAYTLSLNSGAGTFATRRMRASSGFVLGYNIYTTAARSTVWGDGSGGSATVSDAYVLQASAATRNYAVYGRIFSGQKMPVGVYTDAIVVTLAF